MQKEQNSGNIGDQALSISMTGIYLLYNQSANPTEKPPDRALKNLFLFPKSKNHGRNTQGRMLQARKQGSKQGRTNTRKEESEEEGGREGGTGDGRKEGRKKGRKEGRTEGRKEGSQATQPGSQATMLAGSCARTDEQRDGGRQRKNARKGGAAPSPPSFLQHNDSKPHNRLHIHTLLQHRKQEQLPIPKHGT